MKPDKALAKPYADIGGSESKIHEESVESQLLLATEADLNISSWDLDSIGNQQAPGSPGQTEFNTKLSADWLGDLNYVPLFQLFLKRWKIIFGISSAMNRVTFKFLMTMKKC
jgi:hypothetical protein